MTPVTMLPAHRAYVVSTWAHGQRYPLRTRPAFRLVNRILDSGAVDVVVLATEHTVHAWACGEGENVLHYAYVPPELREQGFARRLITALFGGYPERIHVTHKWPFESARYCLTKHRLLERAAA